jgi:hypothetical protein
MATRATITVRLNENIRLSVYSHFDGYPEHVGKLLKEHYNTKAKALELVSYGDISSLRAKIEPDNNLPQDFDNRQDDVTTFYGRDRGEKNVDCQILKNSEQVSEEEFNYYLNNGKWIVNGEDF